MERQDHHQRRQWGTLALLLTFLACALSPDARAELSEQDLIPFTEPLALELGTFLPGSPQATLVPKDKNCAYAAQSLDWGAEECPRLDAASFGYLDGIAVLIIQTPTHEGFRQVTQFTESDQDFGTRIIQKKLDAQFQSDIPTTEYQVRFDSWLIKPSFDMASHTLYSAYYTHDGNKFTLYFNATRLHRDGNVLLYRTARDTTQTAEQARDLILSVAKGYQFTPGNRYEDHLSDEPVRSTTGRGLFVLPPADRPNSAPSTSGHHLQRWATSLGEVLLLLIAVPFVVVYRMLRKHFKKMPPPPRA
jgi:hypothetical protein